jgi:hypothetical protein
MDTLEELDSCWQASLTVSIIFGLCIAITLFLDSGGLADEQLNEHTKPCFASPAHVVNELEETQVEWRFLLGNTSAWA